MSYFTYTKFLGKNCFPTHSARNQTTLFMKPSKLLIFILCILITNCNLQAQNRTIKGKVVTADNSGISGASVTVKGTKLGTATNNDGAFSISVPSGRVILVVSSVGLLNREMPVDAGQDEINVTLNADTKELGEVVVTALGITREAKTLVYATQTVKPA